MDPGLQLDFYCERLGPGLFAEPFNAASNLAFLIAAYVLWSRKERLPRAAALLLPLLVALVGVGSFAFHSFATVWAHWLDLLFIELFIYCFMALYLRHIHGLRWGFVLPLLFAYGVFEWALTGLFAPGSFNGSYRYLPALMGVAAMSAAAFGVAPRAAKRLAAAACVFIVAVLFRTADLAICEAWPFGTHFVWHALNALVLYFCVSALRRDAV